MTPVCELSMYPRSIVNILMKTNIQAMDYSRLMINRWWVSSNACLIRSLTYWSIYPQGTYTCWVFPFLSCAIWTLLMSVFLGVFEWTCDISCCVWMKSLEESKVTWQIKLCNLHVTWWIIKLSKGTFPLICFKASAWTCYRPIYNWVAG